MVESAAGVVFSVSEKAEMITALPLLLCDERLRELYIWGKIEGTLRTYLIAKGFAGSDLGAKAKYFFSLTGGQWAQLPEVTDEVVEVLESAGVGAQSQKRFSGDSSLVFKKDGEPEDEEEVEETQDGTVVTELHRLARTVTLIDVETGIVPHSAYFVCPHGQVTRNPSFNALSVGEAQMLSAFARTGTTLATLEANPRMEPSELHKMKTLEDDKPDGLWGLTFETDRMLVTIRNRFFPGHMFFIQVGTKVWGTVYRGSGLRNLDVAFMLTQTTE